MLAMAIFASQCFCLNAAENDNKPLTMILTGASFAVPENGWFEIACEDMGAKGINKAVSGQAIMNTANDMHNGKFYTFEQLENADVLVIDHVHNQNVANPEWLKDDYNDYTMPIYNYSIGYDYVIKRYKDDCYKLKDNPESKYYGTENGKPARIVLCTHWHDSRTTFNPAIRKLAEKWDLPLVKFDEQIGFSKDQLVDGKQPSLLYAQDTETIGGVVYGWHPKRGKGEYIQRKMAQIFVAEMAKYLGLDLPFEAEMQQKDIAVMPGEKPMAKCEFRRAVYPLSLDYKVGSEMFYSNGINDNPYIMELPESAVGKVVAPIKVADADGNEADLIGSVTVAQADKSIAPVYDAFVHENYKDKSYTTDEVLSLKTGQQWGRQIYLTFDMAEIGVDDALDVVRIYFKETNKNTKETLLIEGNTHTYGNTLNWNNRNKYPFEEIASVSMASSEVGSYISWDVTDWIKQKKQENAQKVTFRISVASDGESLSGFYATESTEAPELAPALLVAGEGGESGVMELKSTEKCKVFSNSLRLEEGKQSSVYYVDGSLVYAGCDALVDTSGWRKGLYVAKIGDNFAKLIKR